MFWTEGVQVIRQMNGVLFPEGRARGIVITTASNFTKGAVREASTRTSTNEQYEMKLLSFPDIVSMLRLPSVEPYEPWKPFLDEGYVKVYLQTGTNRTRASSECNRERP